MTVASLQVEPGPVAGEVAAPGSKSVALRLLLLAAQAGSPSTLARVPAGAATQPMLASLVALGARLHRDAERDGTVHVLPAPLRPPSAVLDCGGSATTIRFLCALAARFAVPVRLGGSDALLGRPHGALLEALRVLGARAEAAGRGAPIAVRGPLRPGAVALPPGSSSQFASALVLSLPFLAGDSRVEAAAPIASAPYLGLTLDAAATFGLRLERHATLAGEAFHVAGSQVPRGASLAVEGDWSAAAFPLVAAAVTGGRVRVRGLDPRSRQGDRAVVGLLRRFGVRVREHEDGAEAEGTGLASPGTVDVSQVPDLFPALAVLSAYASGTTTFTGGAALRGKESDRIAALAQGLRRMGVPCRERPDGLEVQGARPRGARIDARGDHRVHMAFAVAGLAAEGTTTVEGADAVGASHEGFHRDLAALGGRLRTLHGRVEVPS